MKAVMISIQPKDCEKIANSEKTIVVCKTRPKLETPFKCYIYCTKDRKVIGEFVCDEISKYYYELLTDGAHTLPVGHLEKTGMDGWGLYDYLRTNDGYGWHISDLKIYDKPKELSGFSKSCKDAYFQHNEYEGEWFCNAVEFGDCEYKDCPKCSGENNEYEDFAYCLCGGEKPITRPFQSWGYVEEVDE